MKQSCISARHFPYILTLLAGFGGGLLGELQAETAAPERPNIIFLLTDNHRSDALGCYGNPVIQTPHMDRLAARGTRFSNAFCTTSICAASRVSILNGQYRHRHGYTFQRPYISAAAMRTSYPMLLREAGYRTAFVGKLGLNFKTEVLETMFDFIKLNTANSLRDPYYREAADGSLKHLTRINGDHAVDFLKTCTKEQPFCLSVSFSAPHPEDDHPDQYIYDRELEHLYEDVAIPPPAAFEPRYFEQLPEFIRVSMNRERWFRRFDTPAKYQQMMKGMYRLITGIDRQIGRLLDTLDELDYADNTIVIVTSDNGILTGEHGLTGIWLMYEQSIRLPLIMYDPRRAVSAQTVSEIALNIDFAPTLLDLAGVPTPAEMQGRSLVSLLDGHSENWREEFYYEHYFRPGSLSSDEGNIPRSEGVHTLDWKYVRYFDQQPVYEQLFDLRSDLREVQNLAHDVRFAAQLAHLRQRTVQLRRQVRQLDLAAIHRSADFSKLALPAAVSKQDQADDSTESTDDGPDEGPSETAFKEVSADEESLRIALVGNSLFERDAEHGYLETELTRLWPETKIVFRNLGWAGDTVQGDARIEFGPQEQERQAWQRPGGATGDYGYEKLLRHIHDAGPDVLLIGYGSNVAFTRGAGLERFKQGLDRLLRDLGPTEVRVVLVAPPPREIQLAARAQLLEQNRWLEQVSGHLHQVSADRGHLLVDLFHAWPQPTDKSSMALTDNGIHLNAAGYQTLASLVVQQLQMTAEPWKLQVQTDGSVLEAAGTQVEAIGKTPFGLRMLLQDDHLPAFRWSSENRLFESAGTDPGRNRRILQIEGLAEGMFVLDIDGRRVARGSAEQWAAGVNITAGPEFEQTDRLRDEILAKNRLHFYGFRPQNKAYIHLFRRHERGHHAAELQQFARLVKEREQYIARLRVPVSRHYELTREADYSLHEVPTLAGRPQIDAELQSFTVADGFEVNLFASDPMIANPININWDEQGRLWVATSTVYPHLQPGQEPNDRILILEDIDGDGRADKHTVFADGLLVPHSVIPAAGGAYVTQSTDLLFFEDVDGDGKSDRRRVVLTGFGNADVHHMIHGLRWGPGGDLYFNQSIYINSTVETPWGVRQVNGSCVWKLRPDTMQLEPYSRGLVNPWGLAFDPWGQSFATDGAGGDGIAYLFPSSAHATHGQFQRTLGSLNPGRPKECGLEILSGRHLPEDWQGTLVTCDFRANRVTRYALTADGSGYRSDFLGDVLSSTQRAFRPVDLKLGPDGGLYVVDWYNEIIDHGEVDFHHPLRDKRHGRIWRLTAQDRPLVERPQLAEASTSELLETLRLPESWSRDQARRLLRERGRDTVVPACRQWLAQLDRGDPEFERLRLEVLWVYQGLRVVAPDLLRDVLASPDHRVRAAAVRILAEWHARVPGGEVLLANAVRDEHPQVRLEAIHALRGVGSLRAVDLALEALERPLDEPLDFAAWLTARELQSVWLPALQSGEVVFGGDPGKIAFALTASEQREVLGPLTALILAGKLDTIQRQSALRTLALLGGHEEHAVVIEEALSLAPAEALVLLSALQQARRTAAPPGNASRIQQLLQSDHAQVRLYAVSLAGRWRVVDAWEDLLARVSGSETTLAERLAAAKSLVGIDRRDGLRVLKTMARADSANRLRIPAVAAWAAEDVRGAAEVAAAVLVNLERGDDAAPIFSAFIEQQDGPRRLSAALAQHRSMEPAVASLGITLANQSGRDLARLVCALRRCGQLGSLPAKPSAQQLARLVRDVARLGSAARGEAIYRRAQLQCAKCHAIAGAGGQVGPDLSSLGGSSQVDSLLQSLIEPSAKIKEGYHSTSILHADGKILSGRIQQKSANWVVLRNAEDKLIQIASDEIEEIRPSPVSLMPIDLTSDLSRGELLDLARFLSALGKDDGFRVPAGNYVRQWEVAALESDVSRARADLRSVLTDENLRWTRQYSTVAGALPLSDVPMLATAEGPAGYVRFRLESTKRERVYLAVREPSGLTAWANGERLDLTERTPLLLERGPTEVTLRVQQGRRTAPLVIELQ